jgi:hypothetical protein
MTTATATWPTKAEFEEPVQLLADAFEAIHDIAGRVERLNELLDGPPDEIPAPTLEELGALSWLIAQAEHDVENLGSYLDVIRKAHRQAAFCLRTAVDHAR